MKSQAIGMGCQLVALVAFMALGSECKSLESEASESAVIPSPNQAFGDELDIQRMGVAAVPAPIKSAPFKPMAAIDEHEQAASSSEPASVPVYVSPFKRAQRGATIATPVAAGSSYEQRQESSHAPPNYAPSPAGSSSDDLKTSASYGHHHHGGHYGHGHGHGHGYGHGGWLDMGAWTGGKGSFGWYADYPVGSKHHGYGRK